MFANMHKSCALRFHYSDRLKSQLPFSEGTKKMWLPWLGYQFLYW